MSQRPLSPSDLPDEASADERLAQVSDDLPEPRLVLPLDDEEPDTPVLEDNAPVSLNGLSQHPADLVQHAAPSIELLLTRPDPAAAARGTPLFLWEWCSRRGVDGYVVMGRSRWEGLDWEGLDGQV